METIIGLKMFTIVLWEVDFLSSDKCSSALSMGFNVKGTHRTWLYKSMRWIGSPLLRPQAIKNAH